MHNQEDTTKFAQLWERDWNRPEWE